MPALKYDVVTLKSACKVVPSRRNKCILSLEVLNDMIGRGLSIAISWCASTELNFIIGQNIPFVLMSLHQLVLLSVWSVVRAFLVPISQVADTKCK